MMTLTFEEIAGQMNARNSGRYIGHLRRNFIRSVVEGYEIPAHHVYEFMCEDFDNNPAAEYRNDNNVTPEMVERYAKSLSEMQ